MVNTVMATETGAANSLLPTINNLIESSTTLSALKRSVAGLNAALGEELTPSLLRAGLNRCIKMAQNSAFAREIDALAKSKQIGRDSPLRKLSSFLDPDGLLRVGGRLQHATMNEDAKHPVILPHHHKLTKLITINIHESRFHASTGRTLYEVSATYWIVIGRRTVRQVVNSFLDCRKRHAKPLAPEMAPLPACRVTPFHPPFSNVGVDYFGPMHVPVKRSTEKRYGVLYTCLATRAVHLKLVNTRTPTRVSWPGAVS
jgi:hypothetical protein